MQTKLVGSALAAILLAGAPFIALAHDSAQANAGLHLDLGSILGVRAHGDADQDGDHSSSSASSTARARVHVGTVSNVTAGGFTLTNLFGGGSTSVATNASTTFRGHGATTSAALAAGEKVIVFGENVGGTIAASFVKILGGMGHLGAWFHFGAHAQTH